MDDHPDGDEVAAELAALRTAAGLVARGASPRAVLEGVARHVALAVGADHVEILEFEDGQVARVIGAWASRADRMVALDRWALADDALARELVETRAPIRRDRAGGDPDPTTEVTRDRFGITSSVGVPILIEERVWGALLVHAAGGARLPDRSETRLAGLAELVAAAVANGEARAALDDSVADQAALLEVAELVARGVPPVDVFAAVATELGKVLSVAGAKMLRYEDDGTATFVGSWGPLEAGLPVGTRISVAGSSVTGRIFDTGRTARVDDYGRATGEIASVQRAAGMRSAAGAPIIVDGRLWGALVVGSVESELLPVDTEQRMERFADLVAVALSNLESRVALRALADEQAALRRVATVVAREEWAITSRTIVGELAQLLEVDGAVMLRYEPDEMVTVLAAWGRPDLAAYVDRRLPFDGDNTAAEVWRTHRAARQQEFEGARGDLAELTRREGITCVVASPVIVGSRLWGAIVVVSMLPDPLPADTEERMAQFTELVATAIGNMTSRLDVIESRARIVQTADLTRRRFERDLHDGIQQRLVGIALELHDARDSLPADLGAPRARLDGIRAQLADALHDLRELSRGLHPAILSEGGLDPAIRALARRSAVPATLDLSPMPRLPDAIEVAAYYVVSEALANVAKHADAAHVEIGLHRTDGRLEVAVSDDGSGGADPAVGTGLIGLVDRVEALGGSMRISSPHGQGTRLLAHLPVGD